ncbi:MAG: NADAR family protein [Clostridia bacterium]|nr:NADAR family protein [Clostridia bacterium]
MLKLQGRIPDKLRISGRQVDAFFFHKPEEPNGYLSNWYKSPFELDGVRFSSAEQYIMYRKCVIFGDEASASAVLDTEDTAEQQAIGRKAAGYIDMVWAGMRQQTAFRGLYAKFSQNDDLKKKLLDTGDAWLVECARSDTVWACGIRLDDEARFDAENWRGQNLLGSTLMQVREALKNGSGPCE